VGEENIYLFERETGDSGARGAFSLFNLVDVFRAGVETGRAKRSESVASGSDLPKIDGRKMRNQKVVQADSSRHSSDRSQSLIVLAIN